MLEKYMITENYTLKEVMEAFEKNNDRVVMVVNEDEKVIGSISQGDIIKALARGINLFTRARFIMNSSFLFLTSRDLQKAYEICKAKKITLLPVLTIDNKLESIITIDDLFAYLEERK